MEGTKGPGKAVDHQRRNVQRQHTGGIYPANTPVRHRALRPPDDPGPSCQRDAGRRKVNLADREHAHYTLSLTLRFRDDWMAQVDALRYSVAFRNLRESARA